ncbi:hypothetical protein PHAVU_001G052500 [Phaseolus vulgaris]|uniref:CRC domain-containing protein n=1 Tax=Phaseolus vulgaris TaxID=3885 RepID=V7CSX6_PHAVU|nr:hypothetical protein PHAVU_001G052500g [Phaseolus vulgaris]ESW33219.1 hypothetical protein PHAVU_001G052500g [Phaseolus vulgaris]
MDSPEPFKNNNNSPDSPQEESPFCRYVSSLSPINIKASHSTRSFVGLSSPPLVFKSPRISHRATQFMQRSQGNESVSEVRSQSENGGNILGEAFGYYLKSDSHQPLPERFITDTQKVFDPKNDANMQHYGGHFSIYKYLADPGDIDQMYSADQDVEQQSTDAAETSLSYPTQSNILNIGRKEGLGDKAEESLPLSEDSNKVHQQMPVSGEEPKRMEREQSDVKNRYSHDPLLPQATLKSNDVGRRRLQFEEGASSALESNKSREKLNATSSLYPQQGCGNLPLPGSKPSGIGLHLNSIVNAMPTNEAATTGVRLPDTSPRMKSTSSERLQRREIIKGSMLSCNVNAESSVDTRTESHEIDATDAGNSEEFNKSPSPCKKKKKTSVAGSQDGCKGCRCKKSKCIKLYCECFNAGVYCNGPCGCQDCLNRPEYKDTVMESRQQIESRNTENSARLKRGCNCKRSTCLKKYCECYQAKVGCSSGCGCQGCKNSYGKIEDYVAVQHTWNIETMSGNNQEMVASETDYDLRRLSPITPSLQCYDQGKEAAKSRVVNMFASCSNNTQSSEGDETVVTEMLRNDPYDSGIECNNDMLLQDTLPSNPPFSYAANRWKTVSPSPFSREPIRSDCTVFNMIVHEMHEASTLMTSVEVNSPSQKRVSPPQSGLVSGGLRGGRRIILQSVPSFPPLSSCVDSKSNNNEDLGNSQSKDPHSPSR